MTLGEDLLVLLLHTYLKGLVRLLKDLVSLLHLELH